MRAKRPLRTSGPCFDLTGLMDHAAPELQVQQKNEQELNKFFINVDDNTVSPMITTEPCFHKASDSSLSNTNSAVNSTALEVAGNGGSRSVECRAKGGGESGAVAGASGCLSPATVSAQNEAKFIHVNNTNIFVLIDGISMFVEGKSTFTGTEDARLLVERLRRKKLARSVDTVEEAILNIEMSAGHGVRDGTVPAPRTASSSSLAVEAPASLMPSTTSSPLLTAPSPHKAVALASLFVPQPPAKSVPLANPWASLFEDAKMPSGSPLFRNSTAKSLASISSRSCSPVQGMLLCDSTATGTSLSSPMTTLSPGTAATSTSAFFPTAGFNAAARPPYSVSFPSLRHQDSSSSLVSMASGAGYRNSGHASRSAAVRRTKQISVEEIGHSNCSLDMDDVVVEEMIGKGTQGTVFRVRVDGKLYALKCMNIDEAMNATNDVERQGRKKGLVKELTMITLQRSRPPPAHLMQMFNAVASLDAEKKQLSILMELMSFTVEDIQQMISRIPSEELMRVTQSTFRNYMSGDPSSKQTMKECCKNQALYGSPRHVLGRNTYKEPAAWERSVKRETPMPEVFLSMLARDVLMGLNELHTDYFIIHCDLKPANVLLCYDKQKFKLADFGCGCVMEDRQHVERRGIDLGTMLYKAPERFAANILHRVADGSAGEAVVEFTAKADVWSLGIMLMELAAGVHPCDHFKSDFWNYGGKLKLSKMNKPLNWSEVFYDFILRSVCVEESMRWSVQQLLKHPFVVKFNHVPREKLKQFVQRLEVDSKTFHKRQQSELLKEQILLSTTRRHKDTFQLESKKIWSTYTAYLKHTPPTKDQTIFPELRYT
ncbi:protein kinase, putative [Leishmania panamensis]|uniref:mitogen-activated protein kinase kinase n=1 Tax=Leishmania panamensis TaxID=5679 RepID=A0A088S0B8_LEIPA|nr:protein kinase, putative [Leishmania panamensis]AIO00995.1 protein kinase, putative [Leishmania panamensis]